MELGEWRSREDLGGATGGETRIRESIMYKKLFSIENIL